MLLLDEPTGGDVPHRDFPDHPAHTGVARSLTLLVVEHDMEVVFAIARITVSTTAVFLERPAGRGTRRRTGQESISAEAPDAMLELKMSAHGTATSCRASLSRFPRAVGGAPGAGASKTTTIASGAQARVAAASQLRGRRSRGYRHWDLKLGIGLVPRDGIFRP